MKRKGISDLVVCIIIGVIGIAAILVIIFVPDWSDVTDTEPAERPTYTQQDPKEKTEGHCSILAHKCIVDEWSPKCLWFDCIVNGRGGE